MHSSLWRKFSSGGCRNFVYFVNKFFEVGARWHHQSKVQPPHTHTHSRAAARNRTPCRLPARKSRQPLRGGAKGTIQFSLFINFTLILGASKRRFVIKFGELPATHKSRRRQGRGECESGDEYDDDDYYYEYDCRRVHMGQRISWQADSGRDRAPSGSKLLRVRGLVLCLGRRRQSLSATGKTERWKEAKYM